MQVLMCKGRCLSEVYERSETMEVSVKLISTFEKYKKGDGRVTLEEGATVLDLVKELGLPKKYVRIITVNGKQETLDTVLSEGDTVFFFPPAIGGG